MSSQARFVVTLLIGVSIGIWGSSPVVAQESVSISGTWSLVLQDPDDRVIRSRGDVWLPGSVQQQGYGSLPAVDSPWVGDVRELEWGRSEYDPYRDDDTFKMPFWLTPERVYVGSADFERVIHVPEAWHGKHVTLWLERTHWVTQAWLNGRPLGKRESLSTPHEFEIGRVEAGRHTLRVRVDNSMAYGVGPNAHSITDHTQSNWNGIIGDLELRAEPLVSIRSIRVTPNAADRSARVDMVVVNRTSVEVKIHAQAHATNDVAPSVHADTAATAAARQETPVSITLDLGPDAALWGEFSPHPYTLDVTLEAEGEKSTRTTWFGLRDIGQRDGRMTLNNHPIYLRGTLDCAIYPLTGYPPMDVASWERVFRRVKEFGLNHVRYHSWCPPRAAFLAADSLGVYLQVEGPFWVNQGPQLGVGDPIDRYVYDETDRILEEFGNHPSFMFMAYGNEPSGPGPRNQGEDFLSEYLEHYKAEDARRLYTSGAGWPIMDESQFHVTYEPRIQRWGEGLRSTINSSLPTTRRDYQQFTERFDAPVLSHEIGQWCVFPDFDEMSKYTGVLKPKNFEIFRDLLANNGLGHRAHDFLHASGRLQTLCYKEEIEAALRTPRFGGFQLLDLHDFPGQGTALVGVLDPFWDPKPYITAREYERFAGPITPIARFEGRVFMDGAAFQPTIEVAQFGPEDLDEATLSWDITDERGNVLSNGRLGPRDLPAGELTTVGDIRTRLRSSSPTRATLTVAIDGTNESNAWDVWIVPARVSTDVSDGVVVVESLGDAAQAALDRGETVLYLPKPSTVDNDVAFGFSPAFWNTAWTDGQAPHTLGLRVDPSHPLFDEFPTADHADWQWWDLIGWPSARASTMLISDFPAELEPLVQPIDTWFRSRRLATMFECRVGPGKLFVSSMDLKTDLERRVATRQLRASLMEYLQSDAFAPSTEVSLDLVRSLFKPLRSIARIGVDSIRASTSEQRYEARNAIDGDPTTIWHSAWSRGVVSQPHFVTIELAETSLIRGISYLPRQSGGDNGRIAEYRVEVSIDGEHWILGATGTFEPGDDLAEISFGIVRPVKFIRFTSVNALNGGGYSAIAELDVLE